MQLSNRYNKKQQIVAQLRREIARGEHGNIGTPFMTVREIAEEFGVALVTAQKVVSELQSLGILKSASKRLQIVYREQPAQLDRGWRFAVLVTNVDNPFFSRLVNAVELSGRRRDVEIFSACSNYDLQHEKAQLAMLADSGAKGSLICPAHDEKSVPALAELSLPFVVIGRQLKNFDSDVVMVHNFEAGRLVARHLIECGCRDFIYVGIKNFQDDLRLQGFAGELLAQNRALPPEHIILVDARNLDEVLSPTKLVELYNGRKTGLFCYHDLLAMRMLRCARIGKLKVPQELSIVGFDNLPMAMEVFPSLSSISYPIAQIAENAVEMLLQRVRGNGGAGHSISYLNPELMVRESSFDFGGGRMMPEAGRSGKYLLNHH